MCISGRVAAAYWLATLHLCGVEYPLLRCRDHGWLASLSFMLDLDPLYDLPCTANLHR